MKASKLYHGAEGLNCAQAVLRHHQEELGISDEMIMENVLNGGGRAEGGKCGAIHAVALAFEGNKELQDKALELFEEKATYSDCRSIRGNRTLSCPACVDAASDILSTLVKEYTVAK